MTAGDEQISIDELSTSSLAPVVEAEPSSGLHFTHVTALGFGRTTDGHLAGVTYLSDSCIIYKVGVHLALYFHETGQFRFLLKQASTADICSYVVCPNKRYIAISEVTSSERGGAAGTAGASTAGVSIWSLDTKADTASPSSPTANNPPKKVRNFSFAYLSKQPAAAMAFSSDNKLFVTATSFPDAFLFLWQLEKSCRLVAMNELNAVVTSCSLSPFTASTICTTGPNICRLWKCFPNNQLKSYDLKHDKKQYNYTSHCWVDDQRLLVGTTQGDIICVEGLEIKKIFPSVHPEGVAIHAVVAFSRGFLCGGSLGYISLFERAYDGSLFNKYKQIQLPGGSTVVHIAVSPNEEHAMLSCEGNIILSLSLTNIDICDLGRTETQKDDVYTPADSKTEDEDVIRPLHIGFHSDLVTAVSVCVQRPIIATTSVDGRVFVYNYQKKKIELDHRFDEEALSVDCHPSGHRLIVAFKYKMGMYVVLPKELLLIQEFPVKSCKEIVFSKGGQYFAASVVTKIFLYNSYNFNCIGFLAAHTSMVRSIHWANSDQHIVSGGYEGAIYVWEVVTCKKIDSLDCITKAAAHSTVRYDDELQQAIAISSNKISDHGLSEGTIAARIFSFGQDVKLNAARGGNEIADLDVIRIDDDAEKKKDDKKEDDKEKPDPPSDETEPNEDDMDKNPATTSTDISEGVPTEQDRPTTLSTAAATNANNAVPSLSNRGGSVMTLTQPVVLGTLQERQGHARTHSREAVISRVHDCVFIGGVNGSIYCYAWPMVEPVRLLHVIEAHQATVSFVVLTPDENMLISVGEDHSLFIIEIGEGKKRPGFSALSDDVAYVLKSDLDAQFQKIKELTLVNEELEVSQSNELNTMRQNLKGLISQKKNVTSKQVEGHYQRMLDARSERDDALRNAEEKERRDEALHLKAADNLECLYNSKTTALETSYKNLKDTKEDHIVLYEDKLYLLSKEWSKDKERLRHELAELESARKKDMSQLLKERENLRKLGEEKLSILETEYEQELEVIKDQYQSEKKVKDEVCEKELLEWTLGQRKQEKSTIDLERLQKELKMWEDALTRAKLKNKEHEKANEALRLEIDVRIDTISASEKKIFDLRKQTAELEKLRCVLVFKFNELRKEVAPKEAQIRLMGSRTAEMQQELERVTQDTDALARALSTKEEKLQVVQREINSSKRQIDAKNLVSRTLIRQLHSIATNCDSRRLLYTLRDTVEAHIRADGEGTGEGKGKVLHEFHRQRSHIEKQLASMSTQTQRRENNLGQDNRRKTAENALLVKEINALRYEKKSVVENLNSVELQIREMLMKHDKLRGHIEDQDALGTVSGASTAAVRKMRPATAKSALRGSVMDKVRIDSIQVAEVIQQVERNNAEMAKQQSDIQRLREFVQHLLCCAKLDNTPTDEQLDVCSRIRSEVLGSDTHTLHNLSASRPSAAM